MKLGSLSHCVFILLIALLSWCKDDETSLSKYCISELQLRYLEQNEDAIIITDWFALENSVYYLASIPRNYYLYADYEIRKVNEEEDQLILKSDSNGMFDLDLWSNEYFAFSSISSDENTSTITEVDLATNEIFNSIEVDHAIQEVRYSRPEEFVYSAIEYFEFGQPSQYSVSSFNQNTGPRRITSQVFVDLHVDKELILCTTPLSGDQPKAGLWVLDYSGNEVMSYVKENDFSPEEYQFQVISFSPSGEQVLALEVQGENSGTSDITRTYSIFLFDISTGEKSVFYTKSSNNAYFDIRPHLFTPDGSRLLVNYAFSEKERGIGFMDSSGDIETLGILSDYPGANPIGFLNNDETQILLWENLEQSIYEFGPLRQDGRLLLARKK